MKTIFSLLCKIAVYNAAVEKKCADNAMLGAYSAYDRYIPFLGDKWNSHNMCECVKEWRANGIPYNDIKNSLYAAVSTDISILIDSLYKEYSPSRYGADCKYYQWYKEGLEALRDYMQIMDVYLHDEMKEA